MAAVRTFIALNLDGSLLESIKKVIEKLASSKAGVKWVAPQNVHLTLKFLGNVEEARLPDIYAACERAASGSEPMELEIRQLGCFPNSKRPRVVWLGIEKDSEALIQLQNKVEHELELVGFPSENRKFTAHLTIGRVKGQQGISKLCQLIEEENNIFVGSMRADNFSVMKSRLLPSGPIYSELKAIPFR
jgi:2'-5' RNA ligase